MAVNGFSLIVFRMLPNLTTYAILLKGAVKSKSSTDFVRMIVEDLHRALGNQESAKTQLLRSSILSKEEVESLRPILFPNGHSSENQAPTTSMPTSPLIVDETASQFESIKSTCSDSLFYVQETLRAVHDKERSLFESQQHIERETYRLSLEQLMEENEKRKEKTGVGLISPQIKTLTRWWHTDLTEAIRKEIEESKKRFEGNSIVCS
jgi:hypothetical protein